MSIDSYNGIVYTVSSKGVCTYHAADRLGFPACGVVPDGDFEHIPSPKRHSQGVQCGRCWRMLNAAVLRAWRAAGGLPGFKRPGVLHWTVDGEPACLSKLTFDSVYNPPSMCAPWTRELAEAYRLRVLAAHPGVDVAIVEGPCTGDPEVGQ